MPGMNYYPPIPEPREPRLDSSVKPQGKGKWHFLPPMWTKDSGARIDAVPDPRAFPEDAGGAYQHDLRLHVAAQRIARLGRVLPLGEDFQLVPPADPTMDIVQQQPPESPGSSQPGPVQ